MKITAAAAAAFKPSRQESKAQTTAAAARAIIDSEVARRDAKTARLRAARLAMETGEPAPVAAAKPKPARKKR